MNEHALDAMLYAWRVMKEKEENKMEGIFLGKVDQTAFDPRCISLSFGTKHLDQHVEVRKELDYDCDYVLVKADDVIKTNDELLRLRDEVKQWDDECSEWKKLYAKVNNELFQKGLAYGTLETAYKNEKIAGEMLLKDRDVLKEKVEKLEAELTEIKTARTLREAYIAGVEKGCEGLREERDRWKRRWNSVVTDISKSLAANGVEFKLKENDGEATWVFIIDIPELNEAKKKVEDLEKRLAATKSKETFWRDRKEEEEDYHHYWLHTFDRAVKQAAEKGIHIGVCGNNEDCNAGVVVVDNVKAAELKSQVTTLTDSNKKLNQQVLHLEKDYQNLKEKLGAADNALEYWNNTYNDIVIAGKNVGVKIDIKGKKSDTNAGFVYVTNEMALELAYKIGGMGLKHDAKWSAMTEALKAKGVEVIYMGEEDNKPIIDVKVPAIDILKKELESLKSRTLDKVEIRLSMGDIVWTYCDGFSHVSSNIDIDPANCLCKNYVTVDAESISHGTIPKCKTCKNHRYFTNGGHLCHRPDSKYKIPGMFHVQSLTEEEAEGPACEKFEAKE